MKSWHVMDWAFNEAAAKGPAKLILVCLAHHWNSREEASWPGLNRITQETGLGRRTVIRAIGKLKDLGLIEIAAREGSHGQNRYVLSVPFEVPERHLDQDGRSANGDGRSANGDGRSAAVAPKPLSLEPKNRNPRARSQNGNGKERVGNGNSLVTGEAVRLTNLLNDFLSKNVPKRTLPTKSQLKRWVKSCEELHHIDGHSWRDIEETIRWCQQDAFWRTNVLSMEDLRRNWNKLQVRMGAAEEDPYSGPPRPGIDCPSLPVP